MAGSYTGPIISRDVFIKESPNTPMTIDYLAPLPATAPNTLPIDEVRHERSHHIFQAKRLRHKEALPKQLPLHRGQLTRIESQGIEPAFPVSIFPPTSWHARRDPERATLS